MTLADLYRRADRALVELLVAIVRLYQVTLSPIVGRNCRFMPSCSNYFIEAVRAKGALRGTAKGLWRIMRCNPLCKGGYDPVDRVSGSEISDR
ncbi:MAG: membrane protein insertion efficiency factor YidD [Planctomycetaceae bacterium]|nr:membrane protein insertion efficiency factor YidD [Planctomycetaceae bacterium]